MTASEAPRPLGRITVLDGWRGLAILVVVFHNSGYIGRAPGVVGDLLWTLTDAGWVGVSLFFVLSGFLITGILVDTRERDDYYRSFYLRRTLRIFPLYYGFLVVALVLAPRVGLDPAFVQPPDGDRLWYWLYLSNWTFLLEEGSPSLPHLWSLAVEEQFYLVWPFIVAFVPRGRLPQVFLSVLAVGVLSRVVMFGFDAPREDLYTFTNARMDALAFGAWLAVTLRDEGARARLTRRVPVALVTSGVILALTVLVQRGFGAHSTGAVLHGQTVFVVACGVLMFATIAPVGGAALGLTRCLSIRPLLSLGKYSYAIYLIHVPVQRALGPWMEPLLEGKPSVEALLLILGYLSSVLVLSWALAIVSWYAWEVRFLRLKDRIAPRPV